MLKQKIKPILGSSLKPEKKIFLLKKIISSPSLQIEKRGIWET